MVGCTLWAEKKSPGWNSATSGEHLERLLWEDIKAKQWKSLEARIAPMMVTVRGPGVLDRAATLEHLKAFELETFQIGDLETHSEGADLIVTYTVTLKGTSGGKPLPATPLRMMSVWQQLSKGWVVVAHSTVPATE